MPGLLSPVGLAWDQRSLAFPVSPETLPSSIITCQIRIVCRKPLGVLRWRIFFHIKMAASISQLNPNRPVFNSTHGRMQMRFPAPQRALYRKKYVWPAVWNLYCKLYLCQNGEIMWFQQGFQKHGLLFYGGFINENFLCLAFAMVVSLYEEKWDLNNWCKSLNCILFF